MVKRLKHIARAARAKLSSARGDSLVEVLVGLLIAVLGATLLATMVMAATSTSAASKKALHETYAQESAMSHTGGNTATITLGAASAGVDVTMYESKSADGTITFTSYESAVPPKAEET